MFSCLSNVYYHKKYIRNRFRNRNLSFKKMKKNILKFHYVYYLKSSFCRQKFWKRFLFFNIILKTALSFIFIPKPINTSLWLHVNYTVISFANYSISTFRWHLHKMSIVWTWQKSYYITLKWFHSMFRWCVWTKL